MTDFPARSVSCFSPVERRGKGQRLGGWPGRRVVIRPLFARSGGQRKAERNEFPLEIRHAGMVHADGRESIGHSGFVAGQPERGEHLIENLQRILLRRAETEVLGSGADGGPDGKGCGAKGGRRFRFMAQNSD